MATPWIEPGNELFFPNEFRRDLPQLNPPQRFANGWRNLYEGELQRKVENIRVPILELAHVTHNDEADQIMIENNFRFTVADKRGRPFGQGSYKWNDDENTFHIINQGAPLFEGQGYYSWWSPYAFEYYLPENHPNRAHCISPARIRREILEPSRDRVEAYVVDYLKHPVESIYGDCVFHFDFIDLLDAYKKSRASDTVFIKVGGTLRYRGEICFFLIVCTGKDELKNFPPLGTDNKYFETNGLINGRGRITDYDAIPNFHPQHIIRWSRVKGEVKKSHSYIAAAFAFYYPEPNGSLVVDRQAEYIRHFPQFCLKGVCRQ